MTVTALGSVSIGVAIPIAIEVNAALLIACDIAFPNVSAQITAMASFTPHVDLGLSEILLLAESAVENVQAAIAAIPPIPTISLDAQIALAASITLTLQLQLLAIEAQLALQLTVSGLLATAGVSLYVFDGANNVFGSELATALGGATTHTNAIVLLTQSGVTWTAMQAVFKTS